MIDRRIRLRPKDAAANYVYGDFGGNPPTLLTMLRGTNGVVWNYTPTITEQRTVNYEVDQPVHTNSAFNNYKNTSNTIITIQGTFYAGTPTEAMYLLACMHFFRSVTLMDFGRQAAQTADPDKAIVGAPPPVLLLSGYGRYMYNDIPVIIKSYTFNYPDDVNYIQVPVDSSNDIFNITAATSSAFFTTLRGLNGFMNKENEVWVPQRIQINIQLEQQPTPDFVTKQFNLNAFKRGDMLRNGGFI